MTKKFVLVGKNRRLPAGRIIALNGEAGYQADTLPPGLHVGMWPWQYIAGGGSTGGTLVDVLFIRESALRSVPKT
jgi:hypothetical protein